MKNLYQFMKFGIVGVSNTLLTMLTYSLLVYFGMYFVMANIIGYCLGIANSYFWNSRWVFAKADSQKNTLFKFICVNLLVLSITTGLLYVMVTLMGGNKYLSQIVATVAGLGINYILNKIWTFR